MKVRATVAEVGARMIHTPTFGDLDIFIKGEQWVEFVTNVGTFRLPWRDEELPKVNDKFTVEVTAIVQDAPAAPPTRRYG